MSNTRSIVGDGWQMKVNVAEGSYDFSGAPRDVLEMVYGEFPPHRAIPLYSQAFEYGDDAGGLPEAIVEFLSRWGIKARIEPQGPKIDGLV